MSRKKLPNAIRRSPDPVPTPGSDAPAAPDIAQADRVVESAPRQAEILPPRAAARTVPADQRADSWARRRAQAHSIVERHATYSGLGGLLPLPIVNVAGVTAIIVRMVRKLSDLYGVPFQRDRARTVVIGLMGGTMPTGLGAVTSSTLVYLVPGSNLLGLAVSSVAAIACTRSIGRVFIEHFESGTGLDSPAFDRR